MLQKRKKQSNADSKWHDTLYLKNRDMVPCLITKMDEETVYVDSFFANKTIPESLVKAAHFQGGGEMPDQVSMDDDAWVMRGKKKPTVKNNKLQMPKNSKAFHPWLLSRGGFEFELDWPSSKYGVLKLRLGSDHDEISKQGISIMMWGQSVSAGSLNSQTSGNQVQKGSDSVTVKLKLEDETIRVYLNDKKTFTGKIKVTDKVGLGVEIETFDRHQQNISCDISDLKLLAGPPVSLQVNSKRKEYLLTIPRLKARNLPKQILCANNRDMVRGQLISMTDDFVKFRSNGVVNRYPRNVLTSMVWIDQAAIREQLKTEKASEAEVESKSHQRTLSRKPGRCRPCQQRPIGATATARRSPDHGGLEGADTRRTGWRFASVRSMRNPNGSNLRNAIW